MDDEGHGKGYENVSSGNDVEVEKNNVEQNGDSSTRIAQLSDNIKPIKGQEFQTLKEFQDFYNSYAKAVGFSVRNHSTTKRKETGEIIRKELVCYKQGKNERFASEEAKRRRGTLRAGCGACLVVVKSKRGPFVVTIFREEHNHPLATPRKTHLLPSHRHVSAAARCLTQQLSTVNIPPHQQYSLLELQSGGADNVGCTRRDIYNHRRDLRDELKGRDGDMLYEYLKLEQAKNPSFFFKIEADDEQRITRCFWSDATSRRAYNFYGDVVIFDTTYNTNRYGLLFAPIMGVNHQGQTIIFACAFLENESTDSFMWLFKLFLEVMSGDTPKMIITDQDPAMTKAISIALPNTFHRYCSWHITMKFSEKIGPINCAKYYNEFADCIWNSESCEEFDLKWTDIVSRGELEQNKWLTTIFSLRAKWIPAYVNHVFSANMSSSQRAKSSHSFFKKFVSKNNSLVDFMIQSSRAIVRQRQQELIVDTKDLMEKPKVRINHPFVLHMVEVYTNEIFYLFEDEMWESLNYSFNLLKENEDGKVFTVKRRLVETSRVREVIYTKHLDYVSCSCKKFESAVIPCRHILAYLIKYHDLSKLPDRYILKRWTKEAKIGVVMDDNGMQINDDKAYVTKHNHFAQVYNNIIEKALRSDEAKKIFEDGLVTIMEKINALEIISGNRTNSCGESTPIIGLTTSMNAPGNCKHFYNEPNKVRTKGCGRRLKGGKEMAVMKARKQNTRRCHGCNKIGQDHDKINCPALLKQHSSGNNDPNSIEENSLSHEDMYDMDTYSEY